MAMAEEPTPRDTEYLAAMRALDTLDRNLSLLRTAMQERDFYTADMIAAMAMQSLTYVSQFLRKKVTGG